MATRRGGRTLPKESALVSAPNPARGAARSSPDENPPKVRESTPDDAARRKRLNIEFPQRVAAQLDAYAHATGHSKTEFLRLAIGTYTTLCDELMQGNRVFVTTPDAKQYLRELILPA